MLTARGYTCRVTGMSLTGWSPWLPLTLFDPTRRPPPVLGPAPCPSPLGRPPRRAEPARPAARDRGCGRLDEGDALGAGNHELGEALAAGDSERTVAQVDEQYLDLAAVVAVDGARAVQHGDAVLERQAGARAHLRLEAGGQLQDQAGGDERPLAGL